MALTMSGNDDGPDQPPPVIQPPVLRPCPPRTPRKPPPEQLEADDATRFTETATVLVPDAPAASLFRVAY